MGLSFFRLGILGMDSRAQAKENKIISFDSSIRFRDNNLDTWLSNNSILTHSLLRACLSYLDILCGWWEHEGVIFVGCQFSFKKPVIWSCILIISVKNCLSRSWHKQFLAEIMSIQNAENEERRPYLCI